MSLKIYDFYKINESAQIVNDKIKELRKDIYQKIGLQYQQLFATYLTGIVDGTFPVNKYQQYIDKSIEEISYEGFLRNLSEIFFEKNKQSNFGLFDIFENSLLVCYHNEDIYIKLFLNKNYMPLFFEKFEQSEDFYYQNSCDQPEEIPQEDWKNRGKIISEIFIEPLMQENGLIAEFRPEIFLIHWDFHKREEILKYIPSFENRAEKIAENEIEKGFIEKNKNFKINEWIKFKKSKDFSIIKKEKMSSILPKISVKPLILIMGI